ncbi:MAG: antibiotic biosynthesis monooxygenase [Hydrocarboniphaga sp.]|uniref:antibiotic biosynthesis monooxygenase family protein n=1 Tax=Hydrocarboniphaga sp. TaxID=2033016 RepID=UPI00261D76C8|nr:antibiotic biosynthesis monooxygenase [Hydrocarboniphaga sp.]MDB5970901.1 antibiotic biosynthesis monooxygenase [Hydrocarboniphaga sp.]
MSTLAQPPAFEVIGEFAIDPEQQRAFLNALAAQIEQHFKRYAGFISASLHASDDGRQVVVHGRWHTQRDWEAVFRNADFQPPTREVVTRFAATRLGFQLVRSVENHIQGAR